MTSKHGKWTTLIIHWFCDGKNPSCVNTMLGSDNSSPSSHNFYSLKRSPSVPRLTLKCYYWVHSQRGAQAERSGKQKGWEIKWDIKVRVKRNDRTKPPTFPRMYPWHNGSMVKSTKASCMVFELVFARSHAHQRAPHICNCGLCVNSARACWNLKHWGLWLWQLRAALLWWLLCASRDQQLQSVNGHTEQGYFCFYWWKQRISFV